MSTILRYEKAHEAELLELLKAEPDWHSFVREDAMDRFKHALQESETYICMHQGNVTGYLRALTDGFGIYVSELYVAPAFRNHGYGRTLLDTIKTAHPHEEVYVLSDEDQYYEKLTCKRVGSIFKL